MKENDFTIVQMDELIIRALREDIGTGDRTTACLVDPGLSGGASVIAKEELVLAGVAPFKRVFEILNPAVEFLFFEREGELVESGAVVADFQGPLAALLTGERTALNFLQHLSGIVRTLGAALALAVLLASLATGAATLQRPRWIAALYVEARRAVGLRWEAVPGATGYKVLRSTVRGKEHKEIAAPARPEYFDTKVEPGATYYYVVQAVDGSEASALSEEREVTPPGGKKAGPLGAPQLEAPQASTRTEFGATSARVGLGWKKDQDAVAYNVYRREDGSSERVLVGSTSDDWFVDATVDKGKTYHYSVSAVDGNFQESAPSGERPARLAETLQSVAQKRAEEPHFYVPHGRGSLSLNSFKDIIQNIRDNPRNNYRNQSSNRCYFCTNRFMFDGKRMIRFFQLSNPSISLLVL